jgi:cell division protein FtsW (lipid II flippase)
MAEMNLTLQRIYFLGKQFLWAIILVALVYFFVNYPANEWSYYVHGGAILFAGIMLLKAFYKDFKSK